MHDAMLNAAKPNALAMRIECFSPIVNDGRERGWSDESRRARDQQERLVHQRDEILAKMKVGVGQPSEKLATQQTD